MKLIGYSLPYVIATTLLGAESVEPVSGKISSRLTEEIRSSLPQYKPTSGTAPAEPEQPNSNPDALVLPKVVVKENAPLKANPDDLLTTKVLDKKLARDFRNSLEGLDAVLNGFSLPLISPSLAARGRAAHKARRLQDLNHSINATKAVDPKAAAEMNKAVSEMDKANDWQHRR